MKSIQEFYKKIEDSSVLAFPSEKINLSRDIDDNKFLELASEIKADYLITGDKDLLALTEFEETLIIKPTEFLKRLKP